MYASWELVATGVERVLLEWATSHLPTLLQRARALEAFALSKVWYLAQILPMPTGIASHLRRVVTEFFWNGRLERLAFEVLHLPVSEGGLHLSAVSARAQALLVKQACHRLAGGGNPAAHIAYCVGLCLRDCLPVPGGGSHAEVIPPVFKELASLLQEVFFLPEVSVTSLLDITSKYVYA